jgi:regulator of protease activity HflC (stomatin/prohibitin superfamily)
MRMDTFDANTSVLANDQIALSPHPSEFFLVLSMQREREIADRAERAERAERERAAERESAAAERQLQMLVAVAMMTCASAVVCAVILRLK